MKNYSIVRIGHEYVVQADEKSILKISSRRKAARLISDAAELLDSSLVPAQVHDAPSIACDTEAMPDPGGISDPAVIPDPPEAA
jgi:hypothetical protein